MTWLLVSIGLWLLSKFLKAIESGSAQTYTTAGREETIRRKSVDHVDKYLSEIDAICEKKRIGYALGFIQTCVALQMAKADGHISVEELKIIKECILGNFGSLLSESDLKKAYDLNKQYLGKLSKSETSKLAGTLVVHLCNIVEETFSDEEAKKQLIVQILTLPYEVALADGHVSREEERLFNSICEAVGIDDETIEYIKRIAEFRSQERANFEKHINDQTIKIREALQLFGLSPGFTEQEFKEAWRNFAKLHHPDRFHNVDPIIYTQAKERFQAGAAARDLIEQNLAEIQANPQKYFVKPNQVIPASPKYPAAPQPEPDQRKTQETSHAPDAKTTTESDVQTYPEGDSGFVSTLAKAIADFFARRIAAIRRLDGKYILTFMQQHKLKFIGMTLILLTIGGAILVYPEIRFQHNYAKLLSPETSIHEKGFQFFMNTTDYDGRLKDRIKKESDPLHTLAIVEVLQAKGIPLGD
ncbi:MAG: TerB family tellurite resistance protein [Turneriella sp.]|nr:TerB family tellurite resistance protein [Turneriella sp.]